MLSRMRLVAGLAGAALTMIAVPAADAAGGHVRAGAAIVDGTYDVGSSAGQYSSTRDGGYGDADPHAHSVKNQASYGVQSRESVRALVLEGTDGQLVAFVSDDHYIPQDALWRRTAQLLNARTNGRIGEKNLVMTVTHNHSSPSYSALTWGVWAFQDAFDFRFFDYYANQNAKAVLKALANMHRARVSATASYFDKFQRNPMGPTRADDGTPAGFPHSFTDHDLSVIRIDNIDKPKRPKPLATVVNLGQHPEFLEGYDLISGEFPETMSRIVDRTTGGVTLFTQNATGTSEVERDVNHSIHERQLFDHAQYAQMEWGARQLADAVLTSWKDIGAQRPNADTESHFGMTPYSDRFIPWTTSFPLAIEDRWFPGPVSHPYPGVSSCRTDPALAGNPRVPVVGLPDCTDVPAGASLTPVTGALPFTTPGISTDTLETLGIPIPENYSFPSQGALEDTSGVHLQAIRMGDMLLTICSCEQWVDQSYNIKTRTDTKPGNEWLGYDWSKDCAQGTDDSWTCPTSGATKLPDSAIQHMRAQVLNDGAGWDDPACTELGCGVQAESESTDLAKIRGNYTHDDTTIRGGSNQTADYAARHGYKLTMTVAMANDYNGYIATYREYMNRDHYRKALTGWGPHSSDYMATRLTRLGHSLKGDAAARSALDEETDVTKASPGYAAGAARIAADQLAEEAKVTAVGEVAAAGVKLYGATLPDDGGVDAALVQPKDIERFDAATFSWDGGNNYTDNPTVTVQRKVGHRWERFADQSGEVPVTLRYPTDDPSGIASYRAGGQIWKWTATFEAFVSRFDLVDPQGRSYRATPPGEYRFVVRGKWRKGNANAKYRRISDTFTVKPWSGITIVDPARDAKGHVTFGAGPTREFDEPRVRRTASPDLGTLHFTIGPVDFPDTALDQRATGARFLNNVRGYSAEPGADPMVAAQFEHYCLDCRFRDWLDATDELTATVTIQPAVGRCTVTEEVPFVNGGFVTKATLGRGDRATIAIRDAWGNLSGRTATVEGSPSAPVIPHCGR